MKVDRAALISTCKAFGPFLKAPAGIDGAQLLWALAGNESAFGQNCSPRHEPGYCPITKGRYAPSIAPLSAKWGCLAHASFGCWQVMFSNCTGFTPLELLQDLDKQAHVTIAFLNTVIFGAHGAATLPEIGDAYNTGNFRDLVARADQLGISLVDLESNPAEMAKFADAAYMSNLLKNYSAPMV